ncbi:chloride channel protein [Labrys monachus]|uniref:CIC family chloride channel protein n=1 Tax=Labrys monachus TaxID=217067 RepID=A0ABU0FMX9_9HYPH|nr:chloride channel protein [Labrys monachus]MDQ0395968.1 CIC family chloride channel protein [Labrys monachus]
MPALPSSDDTQPPSSTAVPAWLRGIVRRRESGLVIMAALCGAIAGIAVFVISRSAQIAHELFFGLKAGDRLSGMESLPAALVLAVPVLGGLALGLFNLVLARSHARRPVDPIEANALHGGRMSLGGSLIVGAQTLISNACGASVGLEAAYSQLGSGFAARFGLAFRLRRADMRLMVGCGSAGAIAAAFGAPLTGAFYAFEIIIGSYAVGTLAPVAAAAITGTIVTHVLGLEPYQFAVGAAFQPHASGVATLCGLGLFCAGSAIAIMQGVALSETLFRRIRLPIGFMPAIGGLLLGLLALVTPQVLSSGHGALMKLLAEPPQPLLLLGGLILLKAFASAISLGSGFRGGLFFASLFLGALLGQFFLAGVSLVTLSPGLAPHAAALAGMAALAAAIVGGPLTMSFLVLEMTGDFQLTVAVLMAVIVATITVRETFGYSFATWRFHLRGEAIRSAHDVGWARDLTVARVMRTPVPTVERTMSLGAFRHAHALGSTHYVVAVDGPDGPYAGLVRVADAYQVNFEGQAGGLVDGLLTHRTDTLSPSMTLKDAARRIEACEAEALAVVDARKRVVGLLSEAHALRRYAEEADRARRDLAGEGV